MRTLAIDTATDCLSLAVGEDGAAVAEAVLDAGRSHLELLLPEALRLLESNRLELNELDAIAVGTGPGTFSGLRVGVATARALAQSLEIPIAGAGTLKALALELAADSRSADRDILPLIDAKRGQIFTRIYRKVDEETVAALSEIMCLNPENLVAELDKSTGRGYLAAGNGSLAYFSIFAAAADIEVLQRDDSRHKVRAAWHLKSLRSATGFDPAALYAVAPSYIRKPDADRTALLRKQAPWQ